MWILAVTSRFGIPLLRQASGCSFDAGKSKGQGCEGLEAGLAWWIGHSVGLTQRFSLFTILDNNGNR